MKQTNNPRSERNMADENTTKNTPASSGNGGYRTVRICLKEDLLRRVDILCKVSNRSRDEVINILLQALVDMVQNYQK